MRDDLDPARGIVTACLFSAVFWLAVVAIAYGMTR